MVKSLHAFTLEGVFFILCLKSGGFSMAREKNERYMPLYLDAFLDATYHLTPKQQILYMKMIWWQFHNKKGFDSAKHASLMIGVSSREITIIQSILDEFYDQVLSKNVQNLYKTDTELTQNCDSFDTVSTQNCYSFVQKRTFLEIEKIASKSDRARESANRRWKETDANALLEEKRREEKRREDKKHTKKEAFLSDSFFEDFYNLYPKKIGRQTAIKAYEKAVKKTTHEIIMQGLARYKKHISEKNTETQFIKHPATWLNGGCWDDDYCMKPIQNGKPVFQAYTDEAWEGRKSGEYILDPETNELIFKEIS
jgi:hypothetical protein